MGVNYLPIIWNKQKKRYHKILWLGIFIMMASLIGIQFLINPSITPETLIIRTSSIIAFTLLHFILMIGPLCRLNDAYLPLLYNRRHLGVSMFIFAAIHGIFGIIQFHTLGDIHPVASIFLSNTKYLAISQFPFQVLGFFALVILFLMAAISHDFWLKNLGTRLWKTIHMMVYVAYGLIVLHVALGILQYEDKPVYWILLFIGFISISSLHIAAGIKENRWLKSQKKYLIENGFYEICSIKDIPDNCAKGVFIDGQNIAIFKYEQKLAAVSNICRHQMGPLAEGQIVDGCITCPWHGYQYLPHNGQSPPPFKEKLETYETKLIKNKVWVNPIPKIAGTFVEPSIIAHE